MQYDFKLLDRSAFVFPLFGIKDTDIGKFEQWLYQLSGAYGAKWIIFDAGNRYICSGQNIPGADELTGLLDNAGLLNPQQIVRRFLLEHPDHLDAQSDYLREVRRRAHMRLPANLTDDLNSETDFLIYGILSIEIDKMFSGDWRGIELDFFKPEIAQPEKHSPLMRNVFAKHITKVENAIREQPTNDALWDLWGWMARGIGNYKWESFIKSINTFVFYGGSPSPSGKVCAWLVEDARSKSDWDTVILLAETAKSFGGYIAEQKTEWIPDNTRISTLGSTIRDYPVKSAYVPHLEALLRLGRFDEANDVFDVMVRKFRLYYGNGGPRMAAEMARSIGFEDIAKIWEKGELTKGIPEPPPFISWPGFLIFAEEFQEQLNELRARLKKVSPQVIAMGRSDPNQVKSLNWEKSEGLRWAFFSKDAEVLAQGESLPEVNEIQTLLDKSNLNGIDAARRYNNEHPKEYEFILRFAFELIRYNCEQLGGDKQKTQLNYEQDENLWRETVSLLRTVLNYAPHLAIDLPYINKPPQDLAQSQLLNFLSKQFLLSIEKNIDRKPSSSALWSQWIFWRSIEGDSRSIIPLMESIVPSPLSLTGTVPPAFAVNECYSEYYREGQWSKVIEMLRIPWEREKFKIEEAIIKDRSHVPNVTIGDKLIMPMIEAFLNDGKYAEADGVLSNWLELNGTFTDSVKIVDLALKAGNEGLARKWESTIRK